MKLVFWPQAGGARDLKSIEPLAQHQRIPMPCSFAGLQIIELLGCDENVHSLADLDMSRWWTALRDDRTQNTWIRVVIEDRN